MRFMRVLVIGLLLGSFMGLSHAGIQNQEYGPLLTRAQAPLQSSGISPRMRDAFKGSSTEIFGSGSIASVWAQNDDYTMDYYQNDLQIGGQFIVSPDLKVEFSYLYRFTADNHLDSLTIGFHDMFGLGQNGRKDVDKHRFVIDAPDHMAEPITDFENRTLNNAIELYVEQSLYESPLDTQGTHHALSVGGSLFYNYVGHGPFENKSFEQAIQLNYTARFDDTHHLYGLLGLSHRAPSDGLLVRLEEWLYNAGIGYQYRPSQKHSWLAQMQIYEGIAKDLDDLKDPVFELTLGYRYHFTSSAIEFSVIENAVNADNSTDIAFTLSYRHRL